MKKKNKVVLLAVTMLNVIGLSTGCVSTVEIHNPADAVYATYEEDLIDITLEMVPLTATPAMFTIPEPKATGVNVKKNTKAEIDYSNAKEGYVMIKYVQETKKEVRVIVKCPSGTQYTYSLRVDGKYDVFPLSDGNGNYTISVFEQVEGSKYATANSAQFDVKLDDEFAPFIRPNQYVNYTKDSVTVQKAAELIKPSKDIMEKISVMYKYVVDNLTYDKDLAATVKSGYLPDIDTVLKKGKGICFDYAAVMTAMLRSQGIPTKLVVGYTGDIYHAWINVYSDDTGWINTVVFFDGKKWNLMDPTFASTGNQSSDVMKYIGDGTNYKAKYLY